MFKAIFVLIMLLGLNSFAGDKSIIRSMKESEAHIDVSRVVDSIYLGGNSQKGITVRLISTHLGLSSGIDDRRNLYVSFFHASELNNTRTAFDLGKVISLDGTRKIANGIYEINITVFEGNGLEQRKIKIDTNRVWADDRSLKLTDEMGDVFFKSEITISE
jgi:hypothetical protein